MSNESKSVTKKARGLIGEFKAFISRGNVIDMAVGVIIGGAFTSIVTALTDHIINPLIAVVAGGRVSRQGGASDVMGDLLACSPMAENCVKQEAVFE